MIMGMEKFVGLVAVGFTEEFGIQLFNRRILVGLTQRLGFVFGIKCLCSQFLGVNVI